MYVKTNKRVLVCYSRETSGIIIVKFYSMPIKTYVIFIGLRAAVDRECIVQCNMILALLIMFLSIESNEVRKREN